MDPNSLPPIRKPKATKDEKLSGLCGEQGFSDLLYSQADHPEMLTFPNVAVMSPHPHPSLMTGCR